MIYAHVENEQQWFSLNTITTIWTLDKPYKIKDAENNYQDVRIIFQPTEKEPSPEGYADEITIKYIIPEKIFYITFWRYVGNGKSYGIKTIKIEDPENTTNDEDIERTIDKFIEIYIKEAK